MRLWHKDLIVNGLLPKSQLVSQWRELNSIFVKQDKHILINYIYNYPKDYLLDYTNLVLQELDNRGYKVKNMDNYNNYFKDLLGKTVNRDFLEYEEHNTFYLVVCRFNLMEKFIRGQKDYTPELFEKLRDFIEERGLS